MGLQDQRFKDTAGEIESMLDELDSIDDPAVRDTATGIVQDLLALYGEGLTRVLETMRANVPPALSTEIFKQLAGDELVSHLLLLHDLHPVDLQTRVEQALDSARPFLRSHGGNVELIGIRAGIAVLRLVGSCHGCPGSTITLKHTIEEAIQKAAPDLEGIETIGEDEPAAEGSDTGFVPLGAVLMRGAAQGAR